MAAELHRDHVRAASFGAVAEQYDRYRPAYPEALIDDLAGLRPARVLDVGCGTGKAAVALARRGLAVLGVEVDERMAAVARGHGIEVEVAAFERWDPAGRTFDLLTCGDAWHWIEPAGGVARAAEALTVGGTSARFWTLSQVSVAVAAAFEPVYAAHAPEVAQVWRPEFAVRVHAGGADPFAGSGAFAPAELRSYRWEWTLTTDEWLGRAATISDHQRLGPQRLASLLEALRVVIDDLGGEIRSEQQTYALLNRRLHSTGE